MPGKWHDIDLSASLLTNVRETVLRKSAAAVENSFVNDSGGLTRFPGLASFVTLTGNSPTYLHDWQQDLIAVSNSRVYRISSSGVATDVTGVPLGGDGRCIFAKTDNELCLAAGKEILRLGGSATEILSPDAPQSTHIGYIDGYLLAIEPYSGRFWHCTVDDFRTWSGLDVFTADGKPDDLNGMIISPFREVILTGVDSVEQFERLTSGSVPFYRRWSTGYGILAPYTLLSEDQGTWAVDKRMEFIRMTGQTSQPKSDNIMQTLDGVDDWTLAWTQTVHVAGDNFILLQIPFATNKYGTKGITFLYSYQQKKYFELYDWDSNKVLPVRWPGWSYHQLWGRNFVGGNGKVLELVTTSNLNDGNQQRMLGRTAHIDKWGECDIENMRIRMNRGSGAQNSTEAKFRIRALRDNLRWTKWIERGLGNAGDTKLTFELGPLGHATTWQFEWEITDDCPVDLTLMQVLVDPSEQS